MTRLLVCPPEYYRIAYVINSWMRLEVAVDPLSARLQWDNLMAVLEKDCSASLEHLAPAPEVPDMVFTANAAAMAGKTAVLSRFRFPERQPEEDYYRRWFLTHGYHVEQLPEDIAFEGAGDLLGFEALRFGGYRQRTDIRAYEYVSRLINCEIVPEYLGVGYIIGPRVAGIMVSGSILGWLGLTPLLSMFVSEDQLHQQLRSLSFSDAWIASHGLNEQFYRAYIRLIGAGAVAAAGMMSLARTLPTIWASFRDSVKSLRKGTGPAAARRTESDIPINVVAIGSLFLALAISFMPGLPTHFPSSLLLAVLIIFFGFFFVTVSSRIVGIIGTTSNPISGMTIATIMGTCMLFLAVGWSGITYQTAALVIGAIVSTAAANAGATSQDLKTGYLVGATPYRQQIGFIIGVFASAFAIGVTLFLMHNSPAFGPIGSDKLPAPQGTLMATLIQGILGHKLQWGFVFVGAALAVSVQVMGISALAWAVGAYLPLSTTMPIFVGGAVRFIVERMTGREESETEVSSGMLYSTGLVAGGSVAGVLIAGMSMIEWDNHRVNLLTWIQDHSGHLADRMKGFADPVAVIVFLGLCYLLYVKAQQKLAGTRS